MNSKNSFLFHKSFHPSTKNNQKKLWLAEQRDIEEKKKAEERKREIDIERSLTINLGPNQKNVAKHIKDIQSLSFMYKQPASINLDSAQNNSN